MSFRPTCSEPLRRPLRRLRGFVAVSLSCCALAVGAAPPSDASIETLMQLMRAERQVDAMYDNIGPTIRQGVAQATAGKSLSDEQRRVIEAIPERMARLMREELTWATLKPVQAQVLRETFDQQEVDGLIAFYRSPVGQSFAAKSPTLQMRTAQAMLPLMQRIGPRLQAEMQQMMEEARIPR